MFVHGEEPRTLAEDDSVFGRVLLDTDDAREPPNVEVMHEETPVLAGLSEMELSRARTGDRLIAKRGAFAPHRFAFVALLSGFPPVQLRA